ncbi:unnamed protein product [Colias eurytheme]|nr:unnamed protein product [Colias eurytheme]
MRNKIFMEHLLASGQWRQHPLNECKYVACADLRKSSHSDPEGHSWDNTVLLAVARGAGTAAPGICSLSWECAGKLIAHHQQ